MLDMLSLRKYNVLRKAANERERKKNGKSWVFTKNTKYLDDVAKAKQKFFFACVFIYFFSLSSFFLKIFGSNIQTSARVCSLYREKERESVRLRKYEREQGVEKKNGNVFVCGFLFFFFLCFF